MAADPVQRWNEKSLPNLRRRLPEVFPGGVMAHALGRRFVPRTPRDAVESYWRAHPLRADRLARALCRLSGAPRGWQWRLREPSARPASFRAPPAPYREAAHAPGPGRCCLCGQPVFRLGWHEDLWGDRRPNARAGWHAACVTAWKFWLAPHHHRRLLSAVQGRRCALTGRRLLRTAEVDHRVPLFQVWRDHRDCPWPDLIAFWGAPNLQVVAAGAHREKCAEEARERASPGT